VQPAATACRAKGPVRKRFPAIVAAAMLVALAACDKLKQPTLPQVPTPSADASRAASPPPLSVASAAH
jgi:hypothetical protein